MAEQQWFDITTRILAWSDPIGPNEPDTFYRVTDETALAKLTPLARGIARHGVLISGAWPRAHPSHDRITGDFPEQRDGVFVAGQEQR